MQTIIINLKDAQLVVKVIWLFKHFEKDGLEIISKSEEE